jgi:hypothetical protein
MVEAQPCSAGPTAASPFGTASTNGAPPELNLPDATLKRRPSSHLVVFKGDASSKPPEVQNIKVERSTSVDGSSSDTESDLDSVEEWVAEDDGGFSPSCKSGLRGGDWRPPRLCQPKFIEGGRRITRKPHVLWLLCILLGPQLSLLAYLCGVSSPSGSALPRSPPPGMAPAGNKPNRQHHARLRGWRSGADMRNDPPAETDGSAFWLLPAAMWQHGVWLIPFLA